MPVFKIQAPVKSEHEECRAGYEIHHCIIDAEGNVLFETTSFGLTRISHVGLKSLYDQTAAALNAKYGHK